MKHLKKIRTVIRKLFSVDGSASVYPKDFDSEIIEIHKRVSPYTMTSAERIYSLCKSVQYIESNQIEGAIVECGVWKGGSMMAIMLQLLNLKKERDCYLYDTFEGMTSPTAVDVDVSNKSAIEQFDEHNEEWCASALNDVKENISSTGYNSTIVHYVEGKVEDTIPSIVPKRIALLRLDTDWYESTRHELEHLFPLLSPGGILIIDDYGHWQGARKAVDEYMRRTKQKIFLARVDYTARIAVKIN